MSTPMTKAEKDWIDTVSYEDLLRRIRFAPAGDAIFNGDSGEYLMKVQRDRRAAPGGDADHAAASKQIGWE